MCQKLDYENIFKIFLKYLKCFVALKKKKPPLSHMLHKNIQREL